MTEILTPTAGGGPLLTYGLEVNPDPLQAGSRAEMILVMSNASADTIACRSIQLTFPVGTDATDLADGAPVAAKPPPGWTVNTDTSGGIVTFTAPGGSAEIGGDGLVFAIVTTANAEPGTATVTLVETASDSDDPPRQRSGTFAVDKFPADFSLGDLTSVPVDKLDIAYGQPAQLNWTAIGAGVTCKLDYQPAESGAPISIDVPNIPDGGSFQTGPLTRSEGVTFTLTAKVHILDQDNPLVRQSQLTLTVEALSLTMSVLPAAIGPNGLTLLQWHAPNANHCTLDDGSILPPSGARYIVLRSTHLFTVAAVSADGQVREQQATVTVDPSIVATEPGHVLNGLPGAPGQLFGGVGGHGGNADLKICLPPLFVAGNPGRVIPILLTGGDGGAGGTGGPFNTPGSAPGSGGAGGDAILTASWDSSLLPPAQYLVTLIPGDGGNAGVSWIRQAGGSPGAMGTASATIDGESVYFM